MGVCLMTYNRNHRSGSYYYSAGIGQGAYVSIIRNLLILATCMWLDHLGSVSSALGKTRVPVHVEGGCEVAALTIGYSIIVVRTVRVEGRFVLETLVDVWKIRYGCRTLPWGQGSYQRKYVPVLGIGEVNWALALRIPFCKIAIPIRACWIFMLPNHWLSTDKEGS